jgi:hypothetical protein
LEDSPGAFFFGAEKAFGRSFRLILEGHPVRDSVNSYWVGGARFSRRRWSVDVGVVAGSEIFPFLAVAWAF